MRKKFLLRSLTLAFLAGLSFSQGIGAPCGTTVEWNNSTITSNVVNQNIDIIGTNSIVGPIYVEALACDITITVTNGDAIVMGFATDIPPRLYLYTNPDYTITFELVNNLEFSGSDNGDDLLITVSGGGQVIFNLSDGTNVTFGPETNAAEGGTYFMIGMTTDDSPTVIFANSAETTGDPAQVFVGPNSLISFAAQLNDTTAVGTLNFQVLETVTSPRMQLILEDGSAFNIGGYPIDLTLPNPTIDSIDFTTQSGAEANVEVTNATGGVTGAALTIINYNSGCCMSNLLITPFCNRYVTTFPCGFVLTGPVGTLTVNDLTYIEYVGTTTNICCSYDVLDACGFEETVQSLRNGSAFIVDSVNDTDFATIDLLGSSAIYFLSGVDNCGNVSTDYTVNTSVLATCAGNIVLDVEGPLLVSGSSPDETGLQILSLQVNPTGCPVTVDSVTPAVFPARTFAKQSNGQYVQYNLAAFLINNRVDFLDTSLIHTDSIHQVFEHFNLGNPYLFSEPAYVGGDGYLLPCHSTRPRPTMAFVDSKLRIHTNLAATGVDFLFPNSLDFNNTSSIIFYSNGRCLDKGYGRNMILGTDICFTECPPTQSMDSHLNVFQEAAQADPTLLQLWLVTGYNTDCITEGIISQAEIAGQNSVQTIYLNNASNFSIGTDGDIGYDSAGNPFTLTVTAHVYIDGSTYSFDTKGGALALPESVGTTGQGGIFVDALGSLELLNNRLAAFGTMVTISRDGHIYLPSHQAYFAPTVGITAWQPDLSNPLQQVLIFSGEHISDFTIDWGAMQKNYCCDSTIVNPVGCFIPYDIEELPAPCAAPAVTIQNITSLPTIQGEVDQLQILRTRIGDMLHLMVDGGYIRELVLLPGYNSADAPVGFIVMQDNAHVGLNTAHTNIDSLAASVLLGVNGVMLVPNGNCQVELNEDVVINNVCHILAGPDFIAGDVFQISSTTPKELRIKSTGILDLTQITEGLTLDISGQVKLVCEPGARIVLGGGQLKFSGNAQLFIEPNFQPAIPVGVDVNSYDDLRVKLSGQGEILMINDSSMFVGLGSFFGIETYPACSTLTDITWRLQDQSSIQIGNEASFGGVFQVGDTVVTSTLQSINFQLQINGLGALFQIDSLGLFGLAAGIVDQTVQTIPNLWLVGCLSNVTTCSILVPQGTFQHNQIFDGSNTDASLFIIGSQGNYTFNFTTISSVILGGGNLVKINCFEIDDAIIPTSIMPTVTEYSGVIQNGFLQVGIMAGEFLLVDANKGAQPAGVTPQTLFNYLVTPDYFAQATPRGNAASDRVNIVTMGYVRDGTTIRRDNINNGTITNSANQRISSTNTLNLGAANILINPAIAGNLISVNEIEGADAQ